MRHSFCRKKDMKIINLRLRSNVIIEQLPPRCIELSLTLESPFLGSNPLPTALVSQRFQTHPSPANGSTTRCCSLCRISWLGLMIESIISKGTTSRLGSAGSSGRGSVVSDIRERLISKASSFSSSPSSPFRTRQGLGIIARITCIPIRVFLLLSFL